jgi:hypothetical protein
VAVFVDSHTAEVKQRHRRALVSLMQEVAQETTDETKEMISDPYPPASAPFTPPHLRKGLLREGVQHDVSETETGVQATFFYERDGGNPFVPVFLEDGTVKMTKRPFARVMMEKKSQELPARLPGDLKQRFGAG